MGTNTLTLEEVQQRIRKYFPDKTRSDAKRQKLLSWDWETRTTLIDSSGTYRIVKRMDEESETVGYWLELCATPTSAPRALSGPFLLPRDVRHAAQIHYDGNPLQADLSP